MDCIEAGDFLDEVFAHIVDTFKGHYSSEKGIQLVDFFHSNGDGMAYARTSAMRYIARYGKKDGYNKKDLMKAIHCIVMLYYFSKDIEDKDTEDVN